MRLLSVTGTRPEAVMMAPLLCALAVEPGVESRLCMTGQHRELLDDVLRFFGLAPDIDLDLMTPGQALNTLLSAALPRLDTVLAETAPDRVIVQGDTTTAYAAALAAHHRGIPVAHVEAGLRTYAPHPWPEEANGAPSRSSPTSTSRPRRRRRRPIAPPSACAGASSSPAIAASTRCRWLSPDATRRRRQ